MEDHIRDAHDVGTAHTSPVAGLSNPALEEPQVLPDDYIWHTEYSKPRASDDHTPSHDCTRGSQPVLPPLASNLESTYGRRHDRFIDVQYAHSSRRMELLHQLDDLEYKIGYIQESVDAYTATAMKAPSRGLRPKLKAAREALQADVESFRTQKQTVAEKMSSLREIDIGLNDAETGLEIVSRAILTTLHRRRIVSSTSATQSDLSLALTRDSTTDEENIPAPLPVQLQTYHEAFNDVTFMQERLYELEAEREEQLVRRDLLVDQEKILEQSDKEFNVTWEQQLQNARDDLERALKAHEAARTACDKAGIAIPADFKHGVSTSLADDSPPRQREFPGEHSLPGFAPPRWMHGHSPSSLIPTGPVLAGSDVSSASDAANHNPAVQERVAHWIEANIPPIPHRTRGSSEPGALLSDYYKGTSIRAANSMDSMRPSGCLETLNVQAAPDVSMSSATTNMPATQQYQRSSNTPGPADDLVEKHRAADMDLTTANEQLNIANTLLHLVHARTTSISSVDSALGSSLCTSSTPGTQRHVTDAEFKKQSPPFSIFQPGIVFFTLWTPPQLLERQTHLGDQTSNTYALTRVRRFIVVYRGERSCGALAISTHSGNGDTQRRKYNHDFVFTVSRPPSTAHGNAGKMRKGIHIDAFDSSQLLHATSRVSYARVYTIDFETRVKPYGLVSPASMERLLQRLELFGKTFAAEQRDSDTIAHAMQSPTMQTLEALEFTANQSTVILEIIGQGKSPEMAIKSVAKVSAESELGSRELASQVSDLVAAGMGYLAAVARVRKIHAAPESPQYEDNERSRIVAEYDDVDEEDEIGADNEIDLVGGIRPWVRHHSI